MLLPKTTNYLNYLTLIDMLRFILEKKVTFGTSLHIRRFNEVTPSLQSFEKLFNRLITYLIFQIDLNTCRNNLKIDLEVSNQTLAVLGESYWLLHIIFLFDIIFDWDNIELCDWSMTDMSKQTVIKTVLNKMAAIEFIY